jgi:hypothetical protein
MKKEKEEEKKKKKKEGKYGKVGLDFCYPLLK